MIDATHTMKHFAKIVISNGKIVVFGKYIYR